MKPRIMLIAILVLTLFAGSAADAGSNLSDRDWMGSPPTCC